MNQASQSPAVMFEFLLQVADRCFVVVLQLSTERVRQQLRNRLSTQVTG